VSELFDKDGPDKDGPDKDLPDEQQLDEYLRGGSAVSRQYRQLPSADVPAELDRLVLRQAQQAAKARPAKSPAWKRWSGPLALAASAVLVVSIVIESGVNDDAYLTVPASAPVEVTTKQEFAEEPAAASAEKRAVESDEAQDEVQDAASVVQVVPVQPPVAEMVMPVPPAASISEAPAAFQDRSLAIQPAVPAPAPAPMPAPARAAAPRVNAAPIEEVQVQAYRHREVIQDSPSSISTARRADEDLQQVVVTGMKRPPKQTAGPRNTVVAPSADASRNSAEQEADETRDYSDPEQWLGDIRELRKQNKHEEADREWRRFRYVFPNYEVAEDDIARRAQ
jgi:hypothetical protein